MIQRETITLQNLSDTNRFAIAVARLIAPGESVGLLGDLGAGKTTFVKFFAKALGVAEEVTSPTFVLEHEYRGRELTVSHWDLYRLTAAPPELLEPPSGKSVRIIEWADKDPLLLKECHLTIHFSYGHTSITPSDPLNSATTSRCLILGGSKAQLVIREFNLEPHN